jgi:hypothetical protein
MKPKFSFGQLVATPGALRAFENAGESALPYLQRHLTGDWGEVDEHDRAENEYSLQHGFRLLSAYRLSSGERIWIITEADRSSTCFLLPSEY